MNTPEYTLKSEDLLQEAIAIRDRDDTKLAMKMISSDHAKNDIFLILPKIITENITSKSETASISRIAEKLFEVRKEALEKYKWRLENEPQQLKEWGWTDDKIKEEMYRYQGKLAEADILHDVLEKAYLRVAERAGCAQQLSFLFREQREQQRAAYEGIG